MKPQNKLKYVLAIKTNFIDRVNEVKDRYKNSDFSRAYFLRYQFGLCISLKKTTNSNKIRNLKSRNEFRTWFLSELIEFKKAQPCANFLYHPNNKEVLINGDDSIFNDRDNLFYFKTFDYETRLNFLDLLIDKLKN